MPQTTWTELNYSTDIFILFLPALLMFPSLNELPALEISLSNVTSNVFQALCTLDLNKAPRIYSILVLWYVQISDQGSALHSSANWCRRSNHIVSWDPAWHKMLTSSTHCCHITCITACVVMANTSFKLTVHKVLAIKGLNRLVVADSWLTIYIASYTIMFEI